MSAVIPNGSKVKTKYHEEYGVVVNYDPNHDIDTPMYEIEFPAYGGDGIWLYENEFEVIEYAGPIATEDLNSTIRGEVLLEAKGLIEGDRNVTHGSPTENFTNIAKLWSVQLSHKLTADIEPHEVAALMIQLKLARMKTKPDNRDSYVDIAGYAACGYETTQG